MSRGALITLVLVALMGTGLLINLVHEVQNPKGFLDFPICGVAENLFYGFSVECSGWGESGNEVHSLAFAGGDSSDIATFVRGGFIGSANPFYLRYFTKNNRYQIVDGLGIIMELKPPISQMRVGISTSFRS